MTFAQIVPNLKLNAAKQGVEGYFNLAKKLKDTNVIERVNDDMLFLLTYMAAISTADIERNKIFNYAGSQKEYEASKYFKQIYILASKWGYEYA
ncbi:MAG: flagellar assembly protein FlaJ, partial [Methanosarcina sp.]|nr:flagellar assembly protein FlaJ [Methanosarcina sp.]